MATKKKDPRITKRRVTMVNVVFAGVDSDGQEVFHRHEVNDYVRPDHLDAYVSDAQKNWPSVTVSDEPDAGPGGYDGQTAVPAHLDLPDAGVVYPATEKAAD